MADNTEVIKNAEKQIWTLSDSELALRLKADLQDGLSAEEALQRLDRYGLNTLETKRRQTWLSIFLNQFKSPVVLILLAATAISAFLNDWTDALIISIIVLVSAALSFFQEYHADQAAEKLRSGVAQTVQVRRGGQNIRIPSVNLVPGDLLLLSAGSLIAGDGRVLEAKDFFVNQASLTGETFPVEKEPGLVKPEASLPQRSNMVFMGSNVRSGFAKVLVTQTGTHTVFGQTARQLALRPPETEFERGIKALGNLLTEVMLVLVITIFVVNVLVHKPVIDSLLFSIALAVGLTPQLLPAVISVNLSKGAKIMADQGVIVRKLSAIENFGSMDLLCTDKTGTLTLGVVQLDHLYDPDGAEPQAAKDLVWINASFQTGMANPLDEAILQSLKLEGVVAEKIDELPYDFVRKRLSVIAQTPNGRLLICKGAFEEVLKVSTSVRSQGQAMPLDKDWAARLERNYSDWSAQGYRVLGLASRLVPTDQDHFTVADEQGLCYEGSLLFMDPVKPGVSKNLEDLRALGVSIKVITGDNKLVAMHLAQSLGLKEPVVTTGDMLARQSDEALPIFAERTDIFAEVDPNEKERIILALKKRGHVVGYMGDGINDAASLHSADVGISVENAVDVAREAADFVLLDQDLGVLEKGIREGRRTFANTLKYVFMSVSANFGNMFSVAGASLLLPFLPLLPKQILLINFLTDFPEMTIATDNVEEEFILKPHRWDIGFIRRFMLVFGALSSVFDYTTFLLLLVVFRANEARFQTGWFIESVLSAIFVVFAIRSRLPFSRGKPSKLLVIASVLVAMVTLALPYTPLAGIFGFQPLPPHNLALLLLVVLVYFTSAELLKRWFYSRLQNRI